MLYNLQIIIFIGSHLCRYQISLAMRAMPGRSAQVTIVFKNFLKTILRWLRKLTRFIQTIQK